MAPTKRKKQAVTDMGTPITRPTSRPSNNMMPQRATSTKPPMGKMGKPASPGNSAFGHSMGNANAIGKSLQKTNKTAMARKKNPIDSNLFQAANNAARARKSWK